MDCESLTAMVPDRSTPVEAVGPPKSGFPATAAFFDLDKTLIARSSTLAFGRSFYRHGLLSRADMMRGALAQLRYRPGTPPGRDDPPVAGALVHHRVRPWRAAVGEWKPGDQSRSPIH